MEQSETVQTQTAEQKTDNALTAEIKSEPSAQGVQAGVTAAAKATEKVVAPQEKPVSAQQSKPEPAPEKKAAEEPSQPDGAADSQTSDDEKAAREKKPNVRVCAVCGHVNKSDSWICEMCSNYLFD